MNLGRQGEELALKHLESKGLKLVEKNFRFDRAEIDIILQNDDRKLIVFAEVKSRNSNDYAEAEDSVANLKYLQIIKAAEGFISRNEQFEDYEKRFDVVAVYINGEKEEIKHFEDVF